MPAVTLVGNVPLNAAKLQLQDSAAEAEVRLVHLSTDNRLVRQTVVVGS